MLDLNRKSADVLNAGPTKKPENVRLATPRDEARIFNLLNEGPTSLANENALFPPAPEKVLNQIKAATRGKGGMIGIIEYDGRIAGSVGLFLSQFWYTESWHLEEFWNFVHPDFRAMRDGDGAKVGIASSLVDFSKWANENLCVALSMGIMSHTRMEGKVRLYQRKLHMIGAFFLNPPLDGKYYNGAANGVAANGELH